MDILILLGELLGEIQVNHLLFLIQMEAELHNGFVLLHEQDQKLLGGIHRMGVGPVDGPLQFLVPSDEVEQSPFQITLFGKLMRQSLGGRQIRDTVDDQLLNIFIGGIVVRQQLPEKLVDFFTIRGGNPLCMSGVIWNLSTQGGIISFFPDYLAVGLSSDYRFAILPCAAGEGQKID